MKGRTLGVLVLHSMSALGGEAGRTDLEHSDLPAGKWLESRSSLDTRPVADVLLGDGLLGADYFGWKDRLWIKNGFSLGGYLSANTQWGNNDGKSHSIGEFLLMAIWEPLRSGDTAGRLVVGFAHDQTFGRPTTRAFANEQGLVETPNDLDTDPGLGFTTLGLLLWEQEIHTGRDRGLGFRLGQLYGPSYFGIATYLDDDRRYFMARPLAAAGGAQWVGFNDIGLGLNVVAWKGPFYVSAAAMDGKANREYPDFPSLADGQMLYLGEIGIERDPDGPDELSIRLTGSHLDVSDGSKPSKGPGQSVMVSAMKRFDGRWAIASRWSKSYRRLSADYRELGSLGSVWLKPFGRSNDLLALGLFAGDPSDAARGVETGFEIAYRLQLTQALSVMPDLQYWTRKDDEVNRTDAWVGGMRLNFEY